MLKIICFVILLMILVINVSAQSYDNEGKIITEEEIRKEMGVLGSGRIGCCMFGGAFGAFGGLFLGGITGFLADSSSVLIGTALVVASAWIWGGYKYGERIDRDKAIERIRKQRRAQKQNEDKESLIPESRITLPLLSGRF